MGQPPAVDGDPYLAEKGDDDGGVHGLVGGRATKYSVSVEAAKSAGSKLRSRVEARAASLRWAARM